MPTDENRLPSVRSLFMMTLEKYIADNIPRHATVLTFSALFAVAPLIVLATKVMGLIYGPQIAEGLIRTQVEHFLENPGVATLIQTLIDNTLPPSASWWIIVGFAIALLYCMSSFFIELKVVLNHIWGIPVSLDDGIWEFLDARVQGILMGFLGGILLFCGLFITTQFTFVAEWLLFKLSLGTGYEYWSYAILLFIMLTTLFALTYQFVPNVRIVWQNVLLGASATAFLFSVSRLLLLQYFSYSYLNTMFGATSAVVVILLWSYYSVSVFLLGAEFTYVHNRTYGRWWQGMESSPLESEYIDGLREPSVEGIHQTVEITKLALNEETLSAALSTPEQIEFLEGFARQAVLPIMAKESEPEVASPVDDVEKKSWLSRIIRSEKESQSVTAADAVIADAIADTDKPKRRFFSRFSRKGKAQQGDKPAPISRPNPIVRVRQRVQVARSRVARILSFPIRVIRPVREVVLAIGVIGAISIAAVIGLPLWRKKEVAGDVGLEPSGNDL